MIRYMGNGQPISETMIHAAGYVEQHDGYIGPMIGKLNPHDWRYAQLEMLPTGRATLEVRGPRREQVLDLSQWYAYSQQTLRLWGDERVERGKAYIDTPDGHRLAEIVL